MTTTRNDSTSRPSVHQVEEWLQNSREILLETIRQFNDNKPFTEKEKLKSAEQMKLLSTSSDTKGIRFCGLALHYQYFSTKFTTRGLLMYNVFRRIFSEKEYVPLRANLLGRLSLKVTSIGGGPGTDASALVKINQHFIKASQIECQLYDLEKSWKQYLPALKAIMSPAIMPAFNQCDVTKSLSVSLNKHLKTTVAEYDAFLFSYVCNETSHMSEQNQGLFWKELASAAKPGSIFVFVDVIGHSQKALTLVQKHMISVAKFNIFTMSPESVGKAQVLILQRSSS